MRDLGVLLFIFLFSAISNAQNLTDEHYKKIVQSTLNSPTYVVNCMLEKELNSGNYGSLDSAKLYNLLGNNNSIAGKQWKALAQYRKALELFEQNNHHRGEIKIHLNLSSTLAQVYKFDEARSELYRAIELADKYKDAVYQQKAKEYFAHLYYMQGLPDSTFYYLEQVGFVYEYLKDTVSMSRVYNNLAVMYKRKGLYRKACFYNEKSLQLSRIRNDELAISESYNNLGLCHENLYEQTDSIKYLKNALTYYEESSVLKAKFNNNWNSALANLDRLNRKLSIDSISNKYHEFLEISTQTDTSRSPGPTTSGNR